MCFLSVFYHGSFYSGTNYPPIIFPRVSDPIRGSAPQARPLDQSDRGCWYHSTVKPLSIRLLLLQSIGYESDWLQPTKRALKPIQDQPCRWWTESHSSWKKLQCLKKNKTKQEMHWLNQHVLVFLAPDENPADVQGIGTEPGNMVISWTVRYIAKNKCFASFSQQLC